MEVDLPLDRLDFSRPVRIHVNGRVALNKKLPVDYQVLLETVRATGDVDRLVGARVRLPAAH